MKKDIIKSFQVIFLFVFSFFQSFAQPEARETSTFCYYPSLHAMLLFDGYAVRPANGRNTVWKWNGKKWSEIDAAGPLTKTLSSGAYDVNRNMTVIFGGIGPGGYNQLTGDTWTFDGKKWEKINTNNIDTRDHHKMVYAEHLNAFVMYGGTNSKRKNDSATWILKDANWSSMNIPGPGGRFHFGMAYDRSRKKVVLYGGYNDQAMQHDTWEFDGTSWQKINVEGPGPRARLSMTYDPDRKAIILHGGDVGKKKVDTSVNKDGEVWDVRGDTWSWDGKRWTKIADGGPARMLPALGYDEERHVLVAFGGGDEFHHADTWEMKDGQWKKIADNGKWIWDNGYRKVE
ncbi:MAG: hypothetical protein JST75_08725 [Bacteroidetes bacterium]|nr:hypothetical protein [Bacteroidota bacterium]